MYWTLSTLSSLVLVILMCDWSFAKNVKPRITDFKADCEKKFQECLDKPADMVSHKYFQTPGECNHQLVRKGCKEVDLKRVERVPNRNGQIRWRLIGHSHDRDLGSLPLLGISDSNDPDPAPSPEDVADGGLLIQSKNLHGVLDLDRGAAFN